MDEELIDCIGIGGIVFTDQEERKFYAEYQVNDLNVKIGDCVRVKIEEDEISQEDFAFAQVLAVYERKDEEVYIEVRWLNRSSEIAVQHKKMISPQENELIESCTLDDIAAGSVTEVIDIKGVDPTKRLTSSYYICKYMESAHSNSLQKVAPHSMLQRGLEMSHYAYAYTDLFQDKKGSSLSDPYSLAIQRLHISVIPSSLPCREGERKAVEEFLRTAISTRRVHRPVYICGMPGTGKTATVLASINQLRAEVAAGTLPEFSFIEINCLRLKSPYDAYTLLWRGLTGVHVAPKTARSRLNTHFNMNMNNQQQQVDHTGEARPVTVCLVDEMDYLISQNFDVMYHFYSWPQQKDSNFILLGIANTMDLPERLSTRLNSRADVGIDRIIFRPYHFEQIQEILSRRLVELQLDAINDKAREIVARKAASVAGDLRAALKICQRTIEMYRDLVHERRQQRKFSAMTNKSSASLSSAVGTEDAAMVSFKDIVNIVKDAADTYKETPLIATTARACQLDKAILAVMARHRQSVSGGEGALNNAAMPSDAIYDKLSDITQKIDAERYLLRGSHANNADGTQSSSTPGSSGLRLYLPPYPIFMQAMERLCAQGILVKAPTWKVIHGPHNALYSLLPLFAYSDLVAALKGDPMMRFC